MRIRTSYGEGYENKDGRESIVQLVVPIVARENILSEIHSSLTSAHLGEQKTLSRLKERFFWHGHYNDATDWCKKCVVCSRRKSPVPRNQAVTSICQGWLSSPDCGYGYPRLSTQTQEWECVCAGGVRLLYTEGRGICYTQPGG